MARTLPAVIIVCAIAFCGQRSRAEDWPMLGRDSSRNSVSPEKNPPTDWQIATEDGAPPASLNAWNVKWKAKLGMNVLGPPIVSGGLVWVCTTNGNPRDFMFTMDAGCLMCFNEADGKFRWQHVTPRKGGRVLDWPGTSAGSPPMVEGDRLWFITNQWEVICLDIAPLLKGTGEPKQVWKLDMPHDLGIYCRSMSMGTGLRCAIGASYKGLIYVITGNGIDEARKKLPTPDAPSLICLEKGTGKVVWTDNSPGKNIMLGNWSSPLVAEINGKAQVIAPEDDGWIRSFDPSTGKLIWKLEANPKGSIFPQTRNQIMAAPVLYENRVYIATGQPPEHGEGNGILWCIDPMREGDVSEELDNPAPGPLRGIPNPNSAVVWKFDKIDPTPGAKLKQEDRMHRTVCSVTIADGLVIAPDYSGFIHCLDAKTGKRYWVHDAEAAIYGSALICDSKIYVGGEDGLMNILALARDKKLIAQQDFGEPLLGTPVFANGVLFASTRQMLYAIQQPAGAEWPQWRGPERTNVSSDTGLLAEWPAAGPPLLWKADGLGQGVPSVAVQRGRIYTLGYRQDAEYLTVLDAATGAKRFDARVGPVVNEQSGMRWLSQRTPTVDRDRVYVVTARGELVCFSTYDGHEKWRKDYSKDFGGRRGAWGYCDFPLVDGDHLICTPGGETAALVALEKETGGLVWKCPVPDCREGTYSATVAADICGVRQYVQQFGWGAVGVSAQGKLLWQFKGLHANHGSNVHTAIVRADDVFCSEGWNTGCALIHLTSRNGEFTISEVYDGLNGAAFQSWLGNSSLIGEHVYTNAGYCIKLMTGAPAWKQNLGARTTLVVAEGRLYYRLTDGTMILAEATPDHYSEKGRFLPPRATKDPPWTFPVIAGGRLYLRDQDELLCYDLRKERTRLVESPAAPPASRPATQAAATQKSPANRSRGDAIFVATPQDVVEKMLEIAGVKKDDVVYDLGCGDGRIVVTAARKYGCKAAGFDVDPECVRWSRENVAKQNVGPLVEIAQKDIFTLDLSPASVVTLYMGREVNLRLVPQLEKLKPGSRIVSHNFDLEGYQPDKVIEVPSIEDETQHAIYLWTIPLRKKG